MSDRILSLLQRNLNGPLRVTIDTDKDGAITLIRYTRELCGSENIIDSIRRIDKAGVYNNK